MPTLTQHLALIEAEYAASVAAPLSGRRALLVASLIDVFADRVFSDFGAGAAETLGAEDVLAFRARLREACPALGLIADLCAQRPDGPRLVTHAVSVPLADYPALGVEDFMVSLYNDNTVQRVLLALPDGSERLMHEVLGEAVSWWRDSAATVRPRS